MRNSLKSFLFLTILVLGFSALQAQQADSLRILDSLKLVFSVYEAEQDAITDAYIRKAADAPRSVAKWEEEEFNFGDIREGTEVMHRFMFKNVGRKAIIITNVKASCGCTIPSWSKEPVKPGQSGFIEVKFNSTGKDGRISKHVTVTGNFKKDIQKVLYIKGEVIPTEF